MEDCEGGRNTLHVMALRVREALVPGGTDA